MARFGRLGVRFDSEDWGFGRKTGCLVGRLGVRFDSEDWVFGRKTGCSVQFGRLRAWFGSEEPSTVG